MSKIFGVVDWTSVKLTVINIPFLFMGDIYKVFGLVAFLSTIVYNGINIYKAIKNNNGRKV